MVKYKYKRHHFEFMEKCFSKDINSPAKILKEWPFIDMVPTYSSLKRRTASLKEYGIEVCVEKSDKGWGSGKIWTEEEEEDLALAFELCKGSQNDAVNLFVDCSDGERNVNGAMVRIQHLADNGQITLNNGMGKKKDYREDFLVKGLSIVGDYMGNAKTYFEAECLAFGHRVKVRGDMPFACKMCSTAGDMSLTELKNHPFGQQPAYVYGVHFKDLVGKTGHCGIKGVKQRGKRYPDYKIDREVLTTLYHARRIEGETQSQANTLPMYEPLRGNGGTECFEEKEFYKALKVMDREVQQLKGDLYA